MVQYEVILSNVGDGVYRDVPGKLLPFGLYFVMPTGSSLDSIVDNDLSDDVSIASCGEVGTTAMVGPGLAIYPGVVAGCSFSFTAPIASNTRLVFNVSFEAGSSFISGDTTVYAIAIANEPEALLFQLDALAGNDPMARSGNNLEPLTFNSAALIPYVNPCVGYRNTTTDGTGCLSITFNKQIYAPDFTVDDLVLSGGGVISSFVQTGDNAWEVHITGIPLGGVATLLLSDTAEIRDLSAVLSQVEVMGINTIRYLNSSNIGSEGYGSGAGSDGSDTTGSAKRRAMGTLARTGTEPDLSTPFSLLMLGLLIVLSSRRRRAIGL